MPARTGTPRERAIARAKEVDGWNDLFVAVVDDDTTRVRALHDDGASVLLHDRYDRSLLDVARAYELKDIATLLETLGARASTATAVTTPATQEAAVGAGTAKQLVESKAKVRPSTLALTSPSEDSESGASVTHSAPVIVRMVGVTSETLRTETNQAASPDAYYIERESRNDESPGPVSGMFYIRFPGHPERIELDNFAREGGFSKEPRASWLVPGRILQVKWTCERGGNGRFLYDCRLLIDVSSGKLRPLWRLEKTVEGKSGMQDHFRGNQEVTFDEARNELIVQRGSSRDRLGLIYEGRTPAQEMANGFQPGTGRACVFHSERTQYRYRLVEASLESVGAVKRLLQPKEMLLLDIADYYKTTVHDLRRLNPGLTTFYADGEDVVVSDHVQPLKPGLHGSDSDDED